MYNKDLARRIVNKWEWNEDDSDENLSQFINGAAKLIFAKNALELRLFELAFAGKSPAEIRSTPDFPELGSYTDHALLTAVESLFRRVKDGLGVFIIREEGLVIKDNKPLKNLLSDFKLHPGFETIRESAQKAAKEAARTRSRTINVGEPEPNNTDGVKSLTDVFHQPRPVAHREITPLPIATAATRAEEKPQPKTTAPSEPVEKTAKALPVSTKPPPPPTGLKKVFPSPSKPKKIEADDKWHAIVSAADAPQYQFGPWLYLTETKKLALNMAYVNLPPDMQIQIAAAVIEQSEIPDEDLDVLAEKLKDDIPPMFIEKAVACFKAKFITVGPWKYDRTSQELFFGDVRISSDRSLNDRDHPVFKISPTPYKMLIILIHSYPKPVHKDEMAMRMYGEVTEKRIFSVDEAYVRLSKTLEDIDASRFIKSREYKHFRINAEGEPLTPDNAKPEHLLQYGDWSYDEERDAVFYKGELLKFESLSFLSIVKRLIQNYPNTVGEIEMRERTGLSDKNIMDHNSTFFTHYPDDEKPIFHSVPGESYVLNIEPARLPKEIANTIGIEECGVLTISHRHKRAWLNGKILDLGKLNWLLVQTLMRNKNSFTSTEDMARTLYPEEKNLDAAKIRIKNEIRRLNQRARKILEESTAAPPLISGQKGLGYGIFSISHMSATTQAKASAAQPVP